MSAPPQPLQVRILQRPQLDIVAVLLDEPDFHDVIEERLRLKTAQAHAA